MNKILLISLLLISQSCFSRTIQSEIGKDYWFKIGSNRCIEIISKTSDVKPYQNRYLTGVITKGNITRVLMDTKDWDRTLMINTPGQSGDPNSPFYGNLLEKWANDGYFPAYFSKNKILKEAASQQIITPN